MGTNNPWPNNPWGMNWTSQVGQGVRQGGGITPVLSLIDAQIGKVRRFQLNPTYRATVVGQGSTPLTVVLAPYGACTNPSPAEQSMLRTFDSSAVLDEYGYPVIGGPFPGADIRTQGTTPGNNMILGIPQAKNAKGWSLTKIHSGAGTIVREYGNFSFVGSDGVQHPPLGHPSTRQNQERVDVNACAGGGLGYIPFTGSTADGGPPSDCTGDPPIVNPSDGTLTTADGSAYTGAFSYVGGNPDCQQWLATQDPVYATWLDQSGGSTAPTSGPLASENDVTTITHDPTAHPESCLTIDYDCSFKVDLTTKRLGVRLNPDDTTPDGEGHPQKRVGDPSGLVVLCGLTGSNTWLGGLSVALTDTLPTGLKLYNADPDYGSGLGVLIDNDTITFRPSDGALIAGAGGGGGSGYTPGCGITFWAAPATPPVVTANAGTALPVATVKYKFNFTGGEVSDLSPEGTVTLTAGNQNPHIVIDVSQAVNYNPALGGANLYRYLPSDQTWRLVTGFTYDGSTTSFSYDDTVLDAALASAPQAGNPPTPISIKFETALVGGVATNQSGLACDLGDAPGGLGVVLATDADGNPISSLRKLGTEDATHLTGGLNGMQVLIDGTSITRRVSDGALQSAGGGDARRGGNYVLATDRWWGPGGIGTDLNNFRDGVYTPWDTCANGSSAYLDPAHTDGLTIPTGGDGDYFVHVLYSVGTPIDTHDFALYYTISIELWRGATQEMYFFRQDAYQNLSDTTDEQYWQFPTFPISTLVPATVAGDVIKTNILVRTVDLTDASVLSVFVIGSGGGGALGDQTWISLAPVG